DRATRDRIVTPPSRASSERRRRGVAGVMTLIQTDRRANADPRDTAIGNQRAGRAHRLAGREVDVVGGDAQLPGADPELEQAGIDVHERGAAEAGEELLLDAVIEIQEQVGGAEYPARLRLRHAGVLQAAGTGFPETQDRLAAKTVALEPPDEAVKTGGVVLAIAGRIVVLEPVHVAADAAQRLRVLH